MSNLYRIEDMRHSAQEEFEKNPETVIAMAKDGSGPIFIENKDKKQNLILMSWDEYLKMQEAVYGTEARDALDAAVKRSANSPCNPTGEDLGDSGEDAFLEKEFDFSRVVKNPYV